jgi:Lon protease-like protein
MSADLTPDFPLFPLGLVALPTETLPLHIFEDRYRTMIDECIERDLEFGIVWLADDGLNEVGCACRVQTVVERLEDGRLNIVARGTRPLRVHERQSHLPYPAGLVEFLSDHSEQTEAEARAEAQAAYAELVRRATERELAESELTPMGAYAMAATVDFGLDAKQALLNLRSENARLRLLTRLFRAAIKRLDFVDRAQARAKSNGKVRFG